jgi:hypothetical protein
MFCLLALNKISKNFSYINFPLNVGFGWFLLFLMVIRGLYDSYVFFHHIYRQWINRWNRIPPMDSQNTSAPWERDPRRRWWSYSRFGGCVPVSLLRNIIHFFLLRIIALKLSFDVHVCRSVESNAYFQEFFCLSRRSFGNLQWKKFP